jgi:hypothetical protein
MERNDEQPRTDRQVQVKSAEAELSYLQQKQREVIERLQRLRDFSEPPQEAA